MINLTFPRVYGLANEKNIGTLQLITSEKEFETFKEGIIKQRLELYEAGKHFEDKLNVYESIKEKYKKEGKEEEIPNIFVKIEEIKQLYKRIQGQYAGMNYLELITIQQENDRHSIKRIADIKDIIENWEE